MEGRIGQSIEEDRAGWAMRSRAGHKGDTYRIWKKEREEKIGKISKQR